ncbi:hypothetical protein PENSPDRAFT_650949 [Peniophora sp. CONT]|nr:hypothetical protein PENSPDRAFT_650949 [Peniophora sp. CONT]
MRPHNLRHSSRLYSAKVFADLARKTLARFVAYHHLYLVFRAFRPIHTLVSRRLVSLRIDLQRALLSLDGLANLGYISDSRTWTLSERLCRSYITNFGSRGSPGDVFDEAVSGKRKATTQLSLRPTAYQYIYAAWNPPTSRRVYQT